MNIVAIQDANILIDCADLSILEQVFQLPLKFKTSDFVLAEIKDDKQLARLRKFISEGKLDIVRFSADELISIVEKRNQVQGLSIEDCSVWFIAERYQAILLTGDRKLQKTTQKAGIEVHGILWVLDKLLSGKIILPSDACEKIRMLKSLNQRLPQTEIEKRIAKWCG